MAIDQPSRPRNPNKAIHLFNRRTSISLVIPRAPCHAPPARPARPFQPSRRPYNNPAHVHALTNDDSTEQQNQSEDQHALEDAQQCNDTFVTAFPDTTPTETSYYADDDYYPDDSYDPSQYPTYDAAYTEDSTQL